VFGTVGGRKISLQFCRWEMEERDKLEGVILNEKEKLNLTPYPANVENRVSS